MVRGELWAPFALSAAWAPCSRTASYKEIKSNVVPSRAFLLLPQGCLRVPMATFPLGAWVSEDVSKGRRCLGMLGGLWGPLHPVIRPSKFMRTWSRGQPLNTARLWTCEPRLRASARDNISHQDVLTRKEVPSKQEGRSPSGAIPPTGESTKAAPKAAWLPRSSAWVLLKREPSCSLSTASWGSRCVCAALCPQPGRRAPDGWSQQPDPARHRAGRASERARVGRWEFSPFFVSFDSCPLNDPLPISYPLAFPGDFQGANADFWTKKEIFFEMGVRVNK